MRSLSTDTMGDFSSALSLVGSGSLHSSRTLSVGRLRMAQDFNHQPVLLAEVTELFSTVPTGVIIDATLGGAGHAREYPAENKGAPRRISALEHHPPQYGE